jgi:hypothetical protein
MEIAESEENYIDDSSIINLQVTVNNNMSEFFTTKDAAPFFELFEKQYAITCPKKVEANAV